MPSASVRVETRQGRLGHQYRENPGDDPMVPVETARAGVHLPPEPSPRSAVRLLDQLDEGAEGTTGVDEGHRGAP